MLDLFGPFDSIPVECYSRWSWATFMTRHVIKGVSMGKGLLVVGAFLVSLVAVVSPQGPYVAAGSDAKADYSSCRRACEKTFSECMLRCSEWPTDSDRCKADCQREYQRCNCS